MDSEFKEQDEGLQEESKSIHSAYESFVKEAARISDLLSVLDSDASAEGMLCGILDKYQEQCQLLDPHLDSFTKLLFRYLIGSGGTAVMRRSCTILYTLCKVRGFKTVVKFFPHEVSDLEPCLLLLESQDPSDVESWQTRYILVLWLSILVMVPFSLKTVDSKNGEPDGLIAKIMNICKGCLCEPAKTRDGASYLLAMLLTRPDMESSQLVGFLQWCREKLNESPDQFTSAGILSALANIFKYGQRQSMLDKVPIVFDALSEQDNHGPGQTRTTLQRKLLSKLAQRLGLTYLPVRIASWRYQRGCRTLLENLNFKAVAKQEGSKISDDKPADSGVIEEDDSYVCAELDYIIDYMLRAMRDRDTVVRWSGAKGLGRLTSRLPRHLADEVVLAVIQQFDTIDGDQDCAWHGGCLALAELARRGLLLPARLGQVVPLVVKALKYDVRKGAASVGAHVRDAACYVCWAFARAYAPSVIEAYIHDMSTSLIVAAVYDREINCRRAAAAAFQENVGRQGTFPHGIDILTRADYFTLGNRSTAYLEISVFIATFPEYRNALIEFLYQVQLRHWDKVVRSLAASTLRPLTLCDPSLMASHVLPVLLRETLSPDLATRHGCALGLAEVILGLSDVKHTLDAQWHEQLIDAVPQIEKARLYRGRGGEIMRGASCRVIEALAIAGIPISSKAVMRLMESVDENLKHPTDDIQNAAVCALRAVSASYFEMLTDEWRKKLVKKYLAALSDSNPAVRRGFALAIGSLDRSVLNPNLSSILQALIQCATVLQEKAEDRDAESRRNAVKGLIGVCKSVGVEACYEAGQVENAAGLGKEMVGLVFDGLIKALEDYSVDHRGDVGSWVREAAMLAVQEFILMLIAADDAHQTRSDAPRTLTAEMSSGLACALLKQLGEKIDRIRECAASVLQNLLSNQHFGMPNESDEKLLKAAILGSGSGNEGACVGEQVDWSAPSASFPRLVKLLDCSTFVVPVMSGLVISCGGLTDSLVRHSSAALLHHIRAQPPASPLPVHVADALISILQRNVKNDRVVLPVFNTLLLLLTNGCMDKLRSPDSPFAEQVVELVEGELRGSKEVGKLQAGASLLCALIPLSTPPSTALRTRCLTTLLALLCHRFPKVRKHVAEQVYMYLLTVEEEAGGGTEAAVEIVSEGDWLGDVGSLKDQRDALYPLLGLHKPLVLPPSAPSHAASPATGRGEGKAAGYADLVKEMHY